MKRKIVKDRRFSTRRPYGDQQKTYDIGVLFVHGIGLQRRGQTLGEFGSPIYEWLEDRFRGLDYRWRSESSTQSQQPSTTGAAQPTPTVGGTAPTPPQQISKRPQHSELHKWRDNVENWADDGFHADDCPRHRDRDWLAPLIENPKDDTDKLKQDTIVARFRLVDTLITDPSDPSAPAHAKLLLQRQRIDGDVETERWLLSESWWAESFPPPNFRELARWGFRIIPWILGSHLGTSFLRARVRPQTTREDKWSQPLLRLGSWVFWGLRIVTSLLGLIMGLLITPFLLSTLSVLLVASLVPIAAVRDALVKVQLRVASTLGDSFMLLSYPLEAASIVGQVRRDLRWLAARCTVIAIVAHSQGAALAHEALRGGIPQNLRLLFTFGSGLKKLKQVEYAQQHAADYLLPAAATIISPLLFAPMLILLIQAVPQEDMGVVVLGAAWIIAVAGIFFAGILDFVRKIDLPDIRRWVKWLGKTSVRWVDCFASSDPVSQGPLFDQTIAQESAREVHNQSSVQKDHTTYWQNKDEFISTLVSELFQPELRNECGRRSVSGLTFSDERLKWIMNRRRFRVAALTALKLVFFASVLGAIYQHGQYWLDLLSYAGAQSWAWLTEIFGGAAKPVEGFRLSWPAIGALALAVITFWITRWSWRRWNEDEMRKIIQHVRCDEIGHIDIRHIRGIRPFIIIMFMWAQMVTGLLMAGLPLKWGWILVIMLVLVFTMISQAPRDETSFDVDESVLGKPPSSVVNLLIYYVLAAFAAVSIVAYAMPFWEFYSCFASGELSIGCFLWAVWAIVNIFAIGTLVNPVWHRIRKSRHRPPSATSVDTPASQSDANKEHTQ